MANYDISTYTGEFGFENIAKAGFKVVDYTASGLYGNGIFSADDTEFNILFETEYKQLKELGLRVELVHAPYNPPPDRVSEEEFETFVKAVKRSFDVCCIMKAPYLVIHPVIFPDWQNNIQRTKEINYRLFNEYCEIAEKKNVTIAVENMPCRKVPYCDAPKMLELIDKINSSRLGICLDTGHAHMSQESGVTVADMVRDIGKHLKTLHIHDNDKSYDQHLPPFFGNMDWKGFMQALKDVKFKGVFNFEASPRQPIDERLKLPFLSYLYKTAQELIGK
ncbi:MAG: sugar phosphate isomerase/epimerase [Clostridia bacterium]|nr:sugar phosphate isomerase/epimerase [Clostridia bacterium]